MRIILAAILGTLVVFAWGAVSWTVLDLWSDDLRDLPKADVLMPEIRANIDQPGAYVFPPMPVISDDVAPEREEQLLEAWAEASRQGPTGVLLVRPDGVDPGRPSMFLFGLLLEFGGALLLAVVLSTAARAGHGPVGRIAIGAAIVGFAVISGVLVPSNFMVHPSGWVRAMTGDLAVGWGLATLVIALLVKSPVRGGRHARS
ncbi:MAG: hypothetical protein GY895_06000 [Phycisphaera sp.]|nr:hypothetical protein [Phycisphaera sp.]